MAMQASFWDLSGCRYARGIRIIPHTGKSSEPSMSFLNHDTLSHLRKMICFLDARSFDLPQNQLWCLWNWRGGI